MNRMNRMGRELAARERKTRRREGADITTSWVTPLRISGIRGRGKSAESWRDRIIYW